MRKAINAVIIKDKEILLVKKKETWILPGGKPDSGESDLECLTREVSEELSGTEIKNINYYREFEGITPHRKDELKAIVYFADVDCLNEPSQEIKASKYVCFNDVGNYALSDITSKIVRSLKKDCYL